MSSTKQWLLKGIILGGMQGGPEEIWGGGLDNKTRGWEKSEYHTTQKWLFCLKM